MEVINQKRTKGKVGVQIQVKHKTKSKSFTLHGVDVDETYQRIIFLFTELAKGGNKVAITHYNTGGNANDEKTR